MTKPPVPTRLISFSCFERLAVCVTLVLLAAAVASAQPSSGSNRRRAKPDWVPASVLMGIVRAEDERRWDADLQNLLNDRSPAVRKRAALAAGRIGNELAVPALTLLLEKDPDETARAMAAFALGEIESATAITPLTSQLDKPPNAEIRGRVVEALGKIAAALPATDTDRKRTLGTAILGVLNFEARRRSKPDTEVILLALTATLRARPEGAGKVVAEFLTYSSPRIRSDAGNTLARLRANDGNETLRKLLTSDPDPNVRANAARVLGATEDKAAYDGLLDRALADTDSRVRVSAIRALASLKDVRAAATLLKSVTVTAGRPAQSRATGDAETLEVATTIGRLLAGTGDKDAVAWLRQTRTRIGRAPEIETALVRISPDSYLQELGTGAAAKRKVQETILLDWRAASGLAQGLGEIAALPDSTRDKSSLAKQAEDLLQAMLDYRNSGIKINTLVAVHSEYAIPDVLRAYAAFKPKDLEQVMREHLKESDVVVRGTAAELLGKAPLNSTNIQALEAALRVALRDKESNDAALAIIDALAEQKNRSANQAIQLALDSSDYLVRRKAIELLKATDAGDFSTRLGFPSGGSPTAYTRAISRIGKRVLAVVATSRGSFTIEFLPEDAMLTVDNFVQLAKRGYFNGIVFHRVVPNFVVQDGDPRGDGNGGPGYQIRCEINEVPYDRGAVGMALSGKDTGGSQWFITHAPQPHLDGGYTVFGRVTAGMDVVDQIARGDVIRSITIREGGRRVGN
jgi:cyclophilin family peptidyl-prolyl cis-trans isomerase/HEAT repeat protein